LVFPHKKTKLESRNSGQRKAAVGHGISDGCFTLDFPSAICESVGLMIRYT